LSGGKEIPVSLRMPFSNKKLRKAKNKKLCAAAIEITGRTTASMVRKKVASSTLRLIGSIWVWRVSFFWTKHYIRGS
jgi:hypothetical protein